MTKVLFVRNNVAEKSLMINWIEKKAFCREAKRNLMQPKVAQVFLRPVGAAQVYLRPSGHSKVEVVIIKSSKNPISKYLC